MKFKINCIGQIQLEIVLGMRFCTQKCTKKPKCTEVHKQSFAYSSCKNTVHNTLLVFLFHFSYIRMPHYLLLINSV